MIRMHNSIAVWLLLLVALSLGAARMPTGKPFGRRPSNKWTEVMSIFIHFVTVEGWNLTAAEQIIQHRKPLKQLKQAYLCFVCFRFGKSEITHNCIRLRKQWARQRDKNKLKNEKKWMKTRERSQSKKEARTRRASEIKYSRIAWGAFSVAMKSHVTHENTWKGTLCAEMPFSLFVIRFDLVLTILWPCTSEGSHAKPTPTWKMA